MRKRLICTFALVVALVAALAGLASAEKPTIVQVGNLKLTLNGGFSPKALPKNKLAPIKLKIEGQIATLDGTHLPALKEAIVDTDKNGTINAKGVPVCTSGKLQAQTTANAKKACGKALVGKGVTTAEVEFPEQKPINVNSALLAFNGGVKGGTTTIFIHAFFSSPVNGAIVTTVKVSKHKSGRYGTRSIASIPKIAGGFGSVKSFTLEFNRPGYLMAKCPDGHLNAKATSVFSNGDKLTGSFVRSCTPKG
ncbi:MAG TPA: hypothetical protein VNL97_01435 [Solirubrobacterales bacterium]|jgi:hypothetical protein|nr:hypothetical protein [Solirubrobacterales bacterium]